MRAGIGSWLRPGRRAAALLVVLVALVAAAGAWTLHERSDLREARERSVARTEATEAARSAVPQLLSYATDTLQRDIEQARDWLTPGFRKDFTTLQDQLIQPAVRDGGVSTVAKVERIGVTSASTDAVTLLVFVEQTTRTAGTSEEAAQGVEPTATRAAVRMERSGSRWLVADLRPL